MNFHYAQAIFYHKFYYNQVFSTVLDFHSNLFVIHFQTVPLRPFAILQKKYRHSPEWSLNIYINKTDGKVSKFI